MSITLSLRNFLGHRNAKFEIPLYGFHKLSGIQGAGKSTIFAAIYFAFYPASLKKRKKLTSHEAKECSVNLEIEGPTPELTISITRKSKKKALSVTYLGIDYIDDEAQAVVQEYLGMNAEEFHLSSYIVQNGNDSLLKLTPSEKLAFFEDLVYKNDESSVFQENLKKKKAENEQLLNKKKGEVVAYEKQLSRSGKPTRRPPHPTAEKAEVETEIRHNSRLIEQANSQISALQKKIKEMTYVFQELEKCHHQKEVYQNSLVEISDDYDETAFSEQKELLETLEQRNRLENEIAITSDLILESTPPDEEYLGALLLELDDRKLIEQNNQEFLKAQTEVTRIAEELKSTFGEIKTKYGFREKTVQAEILKLKTLIAQKGLSCPCCQKELAYLDGQLYVPMDSKKKINQKEVKTYISNLENLVSEKKKNEIVLKNYCLVENDEFEAVTQTYEALLEKKRNYESSIKSIRKLETLKQKLREYDFLEDQDYQTVKDQFEILEKEYRAQDALRRRNEETLANIDVIDCQIQVLTEKYNVDDLRVDDLNQELDQVREKKEELVDFSKKLQAQYLQVIEYENYMALQKQIEEVKQSHDQTILEIAEIESSLEGYLMLERKGKEARLLSLLEKIEDINLRAASYLDELFVDRPVVIKLVAEAPSSGAKIQIRTEVRLDSWEYDDISQFSAGETQLAELAFLLAINDSIQSRFLFLDECLNNLHQDSIVDILRYLHSKSKDRLILIVSHESSDGVFDSIIPVRREE